MQKLIKREEIKHTRFHHLHKDNTAHHEKPATQAYKDYAKKSSVSDNWYR